jgi:two-component system heavy metal sensor histidine kinase CusS
MSKFLQSYRFRLVAVSLVFGAATISLFAWISWAHVRKASIDQLDAELEAFASRYAAQLFSTLTPEHDTNPTQRMAEVIESAELEQFHVATISKRNNQTWKTENWPTEVSIDTYKMRALPTPGPQGRHPETSSQSNRDRGPSPHYRRPLPAAGEPQNPTRHLAFQVATYEDISVFRIYILPASGGVIAIAAPLSSIEGSLAPLRRAFVFGGPAALAVLALGTIFLLQQAMKPINQLSNEIASLSATSLGNRLDGFRGGSEFGQLIEQYNAMLERLETSFLQAKRFSADAAHELNTPLTILIGQLDEAIQEAKTDSDSQRQLASIQEEANRLIDIVKKLSILAQADSGRLNIVKSPFNASNLVEALVEDMGLIADHLNFRSQILPNVMASGDEGLIRQSLSNLISNAVKYNRVNGTVEVSLKDEADKLVFQVKNTGEAIAEESAGRLFDRFYRVDKARAKSADGGLGLGLSLANEFIKAHGGKLYLACNESDSIVFAFEIPKT